MRCNRDDKGAHVPPPGVSHRTSRVFEGSGRERERYDHREQVVPPAEDLAGVDAWLSVRRLRGALLGMREVDRSEMIISMCEGPVVAALCFVHEWYHDRGWLDRKILLQRLLSSLEA